MTSANEPTPIGDEAQAAAAASNDSTETPKSDVQAEPGDVETADPIKADIKRALARETQDGKGDEEPPPSDFQGFATEGVEKEDS